MFSNISTSIHIESPPEINTTLTDLRLVEDTKVAIFTTELSKPTASITWLRNDEELAPDDAKFEIKKEGKKHTLIIKDITMEDAAKISFKVGDFTSSAQLTVTGG